ncbi:MAG: hypothetical protein ACREEB_06360 [Caulobacteraceae bacterium]
MSGRRIVVLGCAGAGKTTFAARMSALIGAPHVCLDRIWRLDWGPNDVPRFRALLADAHAGEAWISEGNFAVASFDLRLPRADLVVWVERPRLVCAWRAVSRVLKPGEDHRPGRLIHVLRFIWGFDRINRPRIERLLAEHGPGLSVVRLASRAEEDSLLAGLKN